MGGGGLRSARRALATLCFEIDLPVAARSATRWGKPG